MLSYLIFILLYLKYLKFIIMRLDHVAYRVADRHKAVKFFTECLGYQKAEEFPEGFDIQFENGSKAKCFVLVPPEKTNHKVPWTTFSIFKDKEYEYHAAPEIFVSDGTANSIVRDWVDARGGIGGIHHLAYQVDSVEETMKEWQEQGFAEFTTEKPLTCPGLVQAFTKPSPITGIIYEIIEREEHGFCKENVKDLMVSTQGLSTYGT